MTKTGATKLRTTRQQRIELALDYQIARVEQQLKLFYNSVYELYM